MDGGRTAVLSGPGHPMSHPSLSGDAMLLSSPALSIRHFMLVGISLLTLCMVRPTIAMATPEAAATLDSYACALVDPELFSRQRFYPGERPYSIPFLEWDRTTFEALKRRMTACATDANRRRVVMVLRYIDDQPSGRQAEVTGHVDALRRRQVAVAESEAELREAVNGAEADPDLASRRNRVASIEQRLARGGASSALELEVRSRLAPLRTAIAEQDEKNAAANAAAQARQRADEANRVEEKRQVAKQQEADRQADAQRRQAATDRQEAEANSRAEAAQISADQVYAQKASGLPAPVRSFLDKNPQFKFAAAREELLQVLNLVDAVAYDLETCRGSLDGYQSDWTEVQRRYGLVQQVLLSYHGVTAADLAAGAKARRQNWTNTGAADGLRSNIIVMRLTCAQSLNLSTGLADFTR